MLASVVIVAHANISASDAMIKMALASMKSKMVITMLALTMAGNVSLLFVIL